MKKSKKLWGMLFALAVFALLLTAGAGAEDIHDFPPHRPQVGEMDIDASESGYAVGLRSNGTVNLLKFLEYETNRKYYEGALYETDVVDVACNDDIVVLLKSDGTVKFYGQFDEKYGKYKNPPEWTDIVAIDCGSSHAVGLKSDGTVVAYGSNDKGQTNVMGWNNVSRIFASDYVTFGIKRDGKLLAAGEITNYGEYRDTLMVRPYELQSRYVKSLQGAFLPDGTITARINFTDSNGKYYKDITIDEAFRNSGYTAKIVDASGAAYDHYLLDENGDLFYIGQRFSVGYNKLKLLESNIVKFMVINSDYYAIDHNGQIWSSKHAFTSDDWILTTNITYNGEKVNADVAPYIKDGRTLAPIRAILEALGMTVSWDPAAQTATAVKDDITISIVINSNEAYVNGAVKVLDVPAEITNGRTFVPVRFFAEALNLSVNWDGYTKTVSIESK